MPILHGMCKSGKVRRCRRDQPPPFHRFAVPLPHKWGRQVLRARSPSPQIGEAGFKGAVSFPAKWEKQVLRMRSPSPQMGAEQPVLTMEQLIQEMPCGALLCPACGGKVVPTGTKGGRRKAAFILARRRLPPCREAAPLPPFTWSPSPIDEGGKFLENVIVPLPYKWGRHVFRKGLSILIVQALSHLRFSLQPGRRGYGGPGL